MIHSYLEMGAAISAHDDEDILHEIDDILPTLKTGDIILFQEYGWISYTIQCATRCPWDHVGMIICSPDLCNGEPLLWEATYNTYHTNIIFRKRINGICLTPLKERLKEYNGISCAIRRLKYNHCINHHTLLSKAMECVKSYNGKAYDNNIVDLLISVHGSPLGNISTHREDSKFFCSFLIAQTYMNMGILPTETQCGKPAMEYVPLDFSIESDTRFNHGFSLCPPEFINPKGRKIHIHHYDRISIFRTKPT